MFLCYVYTARSKLPTHWFFQNLHVPYTPHICFFFFSFCFRSNLVWLITIAGLFEIVPGTRMRAIRAPRSYRNMRIQRWPYGDNVAFDYICTQFGRSVDLNCSIYTYDRHTERCGRCRGRPRIGAAVLPPPIYYVSFSTFVYRPSRQEHS